MIDFLTRLADDRPILLDGPTGTELQRRGVELASPLWSAVAIIEAEDVLESIHRDYVQAGAEIVTANTFRTHAVNLASAGLAGQACELSRRAVDIARAATGGEAWVAGSIAPIADCYSPEATPDDELLMEAHQAHSDNLKQAGVDIMLVETQVTIREAVIAARSAAATEIPTLVSFVCGNDGRLLSGESLIEAARAVQPLGVSAILVNCLPIERIPTCLRELSSVAGETPIGAYANSGWMKSDGTWEPSLGADPIEYGKCAASWIEAGAKIVGSCCGTSVEHVRELSRRFGLFHKATS